MHGNAQPKTDYDRIEFMLKLCAAYQGHPKTKRTLLKTLHKKGINITNVPFNVALPIIGSAAFFEDEINVQMGDDSDIAGAVAAASVNTVGARNNRSTIGGTTVGDGSETEQCKICSKPGHNARDCLQFMQREGLWTLVHAFDWKISNWVHVWQCVSQEA